ncbi:MAG: hypoxanthine phosphoribosyltransferase [Clostridia bacterium]|nr:hypoxanthine phosphoribosyltransferase [Clostridia bacterium]
MINKIKTLIDEEKLNERISEIAKKISNDYINEEIVLVCILKGATYFAIDLSKKITNDNIIIDFMKVSSYGSQTESSGKINFKLDLSENIENKNVIIVEDIIDTGITLNYLYNHLISKNPKSLKLCVLLDKKERRIQDINVDYIGFEIENKFVVGYGLDYDEKYRNLPYIGYIE